MRYILIVVDLMVFLMPLVGIVLLRAQYTSADLIDEVTIKNNGLSATTLALSIQNSVDNSNKTFLFNINRFLKDSVEATTVRIRNVGANSTKYYLSVKQNNESTLCSLPILKIFKDDKIIYSNKIGELNMEMPQIGSGEKADLVMLLSMNENNSLVNPVACQYQFEIATDMQTKSGNGFYDRKIVNNKVEMY